MEEIEREFLKQLATRLRPERKSLLKWTKENRVTEKGTRFEFRIRSYLQEIYEESAREMVIMKATQVGGTEFAISKVLWFCTLQEVNCIYTFPTATDVREFVAGRLDPSIAKSPKLKELLGRTDSRTIKEFARGWIYFRGSWNERQALSVPADFIVHDEVDSSSPAILEAYTDRLTASPWKLRLWLSKPSVPHFGIHKLWLASSQAEWFLKCSSCRWAGKVGMELLDKIQVALRCPKCGTFLKRNQGFWVHAFPSRELKGYHLDQLACAQVPLIDILKKLEGPQAYTKRHFENAVRGLPFFGGDIAISRALIMQNCFQENVEYSESGRDRFLGVDTNDVLYAVVSEAVEGRRHIVQLFKTEDWDDIRKLIHKHGVRFCVVDLRPEPRLAKALAEDYPNRVYLAEYVKSDEEFEIDEKDAFRLKVSRTAAFDGCAEDVREGRVQIYGYDEMVEEWISHWESLARIRERDKYGRERVFWRSEGNDHFAHADSYNRLAFLLGGGIEPKISIGQSAGLIERKGKSVLRERF